MTRDSRSTPEGDSRDTAEQDDTDQEQAVAAPAESGLSYQELARLRARLARKYH